MKKLDRRKSLAARVLGVGKGRIRFDSGRLEDIKEAITKQDIKDLHAEGIISIKEAKGRMKGKGQKHRGFGKTKKVLKRRKRKYIRIVRKLRRYAKEMKKQGRISEEQYLDIRKRVKAKNFPDKAHLKEYIGGLNKK